MRMAMLTKSFLMTAFKVILSMTMGVFITLIIVFIVYLNDREDLSVWHLANLDQEFSVHSNVHDFDAYLALEDRLFAQLDELVYANTPPPTKNSINRFQRGSYSDPELWSPNWNRSYEMPAAKNGPSILLIHGMSDSPYSLRSLAEKLHNKGAYTLGLRVPGHGTAPSGLTRVTWQDMAAATRLAVQHLSKKNPGQPVYIIGYSNGAALAVNYTLATLAETDFPKVSGLVLLSPAIGVTAAAAFASWQARLGRVLGLEKLAWNSISPEYDPYKYGSFAVNAGDVTYRITNEIQRRITTLTQRKLIGNMPPILAFSSIVDATVLAPALIANLFDRLSPGGHQLVLFDINHISKLQYLLKWRPDSMIDALEQRPHDSYKLTVLTNEDNPDGPIEAHHWLARQAKKTEESLSLIWPKRVYSLSHVALPFPAEDPIYGRQQNKENPGVYLGNIAFHGERGVLKTSPSEMLRLRWNPFYSYLESETFKFLKIKTD
jgi:alpha-beta hydrolase superfamily lysophospholipase